MHTTVFAMNEGELTPFVMRADYHASSADQLEKLEVSRISSLVPLGVQLE